MAPQLKLTLTNEKFRGLSLALGQILPTCTLCTDYIVSKKTTMKN